MDKLKKEANKIKRINNLKRNKKDDSKIDDSKIDDSKIDDSKIDDIDD